MLLLFNSYSGFNACFKRSIIGYEACNRKEKQLWQQQRRKVQLPKNCQQKEQLQKKEPQKSLQAKEAARKKPLLRKRLQKNLPVKEGAQKRTSWELRIH
ncbi:MAG: hypothetical protein EOP53_23990 [Sphingobacteriales bacterium]|nr:MAG: hypothetical protein EOP53_23990 [Sphingobacteriales bacterium]